MDRFSRTFWQICITISVVLFFALHLWWNQCKVGLPPRPPLPGQGDEYVSEYGELGSTSHFIYQYGLFGVGGRIRNSDVLLLGSSHMEYGISAAQLSEGLSRLANRPLKAYNLGLGFADSLAFDTPILVQKGMNRKGIIADLFAPFLDEPSSYALRVQRTSIPGAYYQVVQIWLTSISDWFLDPLLPRFYPRLPPSLTMSASSEMSHSTSSIEPVRFLGLFISRSWKTGDVIQVWDPKRGVIYQNPISGASNPYHELDATLGPDQCVALTPKEKSFLQSHGLTPVYTIIPFPGYQIAIIPPNAQPFVPMAPDGLQYFDGSHLNADGRKIATERFLEGIQSQGLISNLSKAQP